MAFLAALTAAAFLPGFSLAASGPDGGRIYVGMFPGAVRPGYVYLPPSFDPARRYPVVYLLHGMPGSPSEYLNGTALAPWADAAIRDGVVQPFIGVMPAAGPDRYNGEWAGRWENELVSGIVPWVDATMPTIPTPAGRILAGLSAGGFGAADIGLRNPELFGTIESWSGYFAPLRDGPFKHAGTELIEANTPTLIAPQEARLLRRSHTRFFVSSGPSHSHWFGPAATVAFAHELERLGLNVRLELIGNDRGQWRDQLDAGLAWALQLKASKATTHAHSATAAGTASA